MNDTFPVKAQVCETSLQSEVVHNQTSPTGLTCGYNECPPAYGMDQTQFSDNESAMRYRHFALNNDARLQIPPRKTYDHIQDKELRKKLKNRESAQAARDRKKAKMVFLEGKVSELVERNRYLEDENENLRKWLHKMDTNYNCWGSKRPENILQNTYNMPYAETTTIPDPVEQFIPQEHISTPNFSIDRSYYNANHGTDMSTRNPNIDKPHSSSPGYSTECISRPITDNGRVFSVSEVRENLHRLPSEGMLSTENCLSHLPGQRIALPDTRGDDIHEQHWQMSDFKSHHHNGGLDNGGQKMPCVNSDFNCVSFFDENSVKEESDYTWETNSSAMSGSSPEYSRTERRHIPYQVPDGRLTLSPQNMSNESTISSPCSAADINHGLDEGFVLEVH